MLLKNGVLTNDDGVTERACIYEPTVFKTLTKKDIVGRKTKIKEEVRTKMMRCNIGCIACQPVKIIENTTTDKDGNEVTEIFIRKNGTHDALLLHCIKYLFKVTVDEDTKNMLNPQLPDSNNDK